ncbi:MAG: hypothetical protein QOH19_367, partial [Actinomycetota bacterium]|nr:hypothetical protein [Actinomycetota bacterium]
MSETKVFLLPDLGEGLTEAELVNWLVAVGDEICVDQPIAEVETAKCMVEVPSPYAGTVAVLHGEPGQTLNVGKPLISVNPTGARAVESRESGPVETLVVEPVETAAADAYREEEKAGSGNVLIGYGTPGGSGVARRSRPRKFSVVGPAENRGTGQVSEAEKASDDLLLLRTRVPGKLGAVISPLVRRMARDHGVDLARLQGSGTNGLIMRKDVEAAITAPAAEPGPAPEPGPTTGAMDPACVATDSRTGLGIAGRTAVSGARQANAANMSRSRTEITEATVW